MSDPLARLRDDPPDLFTILPPIQPSARAQGQAAADRLSPRRYEDILTLLRERGPLAGWQIAEAMRLPLHSISGRISEMRHRRWIENTGERRKNPASGVSGEVVRLAQEAV